MRTALPHTQVIYHGVPEPKVAQAAPSPGGEEPPFCFAYVGRLVHEKGVAVLLRAASRLLRLGYQFEVKIVGDGAQRAELEKLSAELGLQSCTRFLGAAPVESISDVLGAAQAVVMPSVWEDVAPLVAIEQMMHGRLVIASDIGGLGETVNDSGLKFRPGDDAMLAERMRWVLEDPSRAREIGKKARQIALKQFTVSRMVEQHLQLYQWLLKR
jgi:glycosyltransferase involved in cell wall biosynthesis